MEITIYTATNCFGCQAAKKYFQKKEIEYKELNIEHDMDAQQDIMSKGFMGVPVVKINDEYISGFDEKRIEKSLKRLGD